jgi:hypothetical protein
MFRPTLVIISCLKFFVKTAVFPFCGSNIRCIVPIYAFVYSMVPGALPVVLCLDYDSMVPGGSSCCGVYLDDDSMVPGGSSCCVVCLG